ncbi:MAG TPA: hypothetical protein VML95_10800 [Longimicrobiales bacterium]|nr:hypothetical protein [Longimicrobiales bacterium]
MHRQSLTLSMLTLGTLVAGCASQGVRSHDDDIADRAGSARCSLGAESPWIRDWLDAWELASERILRLPDAPTPEVVFYDDSCAFTTSAVTAGGAPRVDGPALRGTALSWRAFAHDGELTLPDSSRVPID